MHLPSLADLKMRAGAFSDAMTARFYRPPAALAAPGSAVALPFVVPPPVWAYSHHAIVSGIVGAAQRPRNLFLNYYINLRAPLNLQAGSTGGGDTLLNFEPSLTIGRLGLAGLVTWKTSGTELVTEPLVDFIRALQEQFYVVAIVDKFYIPGTANYLKTSTPHWLIIYRHEPERRRFVGAAYGDEGTFGEVAVPYGLLDRALRAESVEAFVRTRTLDRIQYVQPPADAREPLNMAGIAAQLADYAAGRDTAHTYLNPQLCNSTVNPPKGVVYGYRTHDSLREHLQRATRERQRIDLRATRAILEHRELMYERVRVLGLRGILGPSDHLLELARQMKAAAAELHMRAVSRSSYRQREALGVAEAERLLIAIREPEEKLVPALIRGLNG